MPRDVSMHVAGQFSNGPGHRVVGIKNWNVDTVRLKVQLLVDPEPCRSRMMAVECYGRLQQSVFSILLPQHHQVALGALVCARWLEATVHKVVGAQFYDLFRTYTFYDAQGSQTDPAKGYTIRGC